MLDIILLCPHKLSMGSSINRIWRSYYWQNGQRNRQPHKYCHLDMESAIVDCRMCSY